MAKRKFSPKQLAAQRKFAAMARARAKAARKGKRKKSSGRKSAPAKQPRKARKMANKKKRGFASRVRRLNPWTVAKRVADANAVVQMVEPPASRAIPSLMQGDIAGALRGVREGMKESVSGRNLAEAIVPTATVRIAEQGVRFFKRLTR